MPLHQTAIVKQIDDVLHQHQGAANLSDASGISSALSMWLSTIQRLAPPGSVYADSVPGYAVQMTRGVIEASMALEPVRGILQSLRYDYEHGYLQSVVELVHADIFSDFLEMADYLLHQGYRNPAAVITGSVLESHLRKLCDKRAMSVVKPDGSPKKADTLNAELAAADIYSKLDQKSVTAWLDLRNKAAHGKYTEYTAEQVKLMLQGVRDFASRYSA